VRSSAGGGSRAAAASLAALVGALAGGCSSGPTSYVVLTLHSSKPMPIMGVTDIGVQVLKGTTQMKTLTYHHDPLTIDQNTNTTLSVSFTGSEVGNVSFVVEALVTGCVVGTGATSAAIQRGGTAYAPTVMLDAVSGCPQGDGGAGPDAFPGCDPVSPQCGDGGMTCQVNCQKRLGECTPGGNGAPGSVCQQNSDCTPGTQCFDYSGTGCNVKVCLRFCNTVAECPQPGPSAGVNPGSVCMGPVECSGIATAYHTCTFGCDPRQSAIASGNTGCPSGLSCLLVGRADQVDCACPESTRVGTEGAACAQAVDCAPGLVCDLMSGVGKCRPLCHCVAQGASCTINDNDCPTAGTKCVPLTDDTLYGACI
jgi:hypothetical protein